jgi:hypothetical protein
MTVPQPPFFKNKILTRTFLQLEDMGFDRDLVLEVFFACNKNEDLAANYLLDHQNEFDD